MLTTQLRRWIEQDRDHTQDGVPWARTGGRFFTFGLVVVIASLCAGLITYIVLMGISPIVPTHDVVVTLLTVDIFLVLLMSVVIGVQVAALWRARRRRSAGARLHVKIVSLFSVVAVLPGILLAVFASISLDRGLDHWFSTRTKRIVSNSLNVANAYLQEHGSALRTDMAALARDVEDAAEYFKTKPLEFQGLLVAQATLRQLPIVLIIDAKGNVLAAGAKQLSVPGTAPPAKVLEAAQSGEVVIIPPRRTNRVGALKRLTKLPGAYLYVARLVNPVVLRHYRRTRASVIEYGQLEQRRTGVQYALAITYLVLALTFLLAAIWLGLWFAGRLVAPIRRLIGAAQRVSGGDLTVQVPVRRGEGDLKKLSTTFNRMTSELSTQRDELVAKHEQLLDRRRFIEAVLSGVSAGVVGLDTDGRITLVNPSATQLLGKSQTDLVSMELEQAIPEFAPYLAQAKAGEAASGRGPTNGEIKLLVDGEERELALQITRESSGEHGSGYVLTFDDITDLVSAQRTAAWADVARRIAHEIKNPLTPIQLSAERIRRKYADSIPGEREIFDRCTDTIIRQVGDIRRMVDEFSSFARMPSAVMEEHDIRDVVKEAVFLFQVSASDIEFTFDLEDDPIRIYCDRRLLTQAVTNLVKNASEAIEGYVESGEAGDDYQPRIVTRVKRDADEIEIAIIDNGRGLPKKDRTRLTEPYMTTRAKGTGIGLAVVKKVAEQHGGSLQLGDAAGAYGHSQGAAIIMRISLDPRSRSAEDLDGDEISEHAAKVAGPGKTLDHVTSGTAPANARD